MSPDPPVISPSWLIREPRESELAACRMLLPDACAQPAGRVFRLALEPAGSKIVAAYSYLDDTQALLGVHLHVVKTRRRAGIGSHLIQHILDEARTLGRQRILVDADLKKEPDSERFLTDRGFRLIGRLTSARGPVMGRSADREKFLARVAASEELPASARITDISEAPPGEILRLYGDHIANVPAMEGVVRTFHPEQFRESVVVMLGETMIGFILAKVSGETIRIPALVVLPEYRGKGLAIQMLAALDQRLDPDVRWCEFEFADSAIFSAKIAAALGQEVVRIGARFERVIQT